MNETKDGGQAFPRHFIEVINGVETTRFDGMSLRDYFAGQALAVIPGDVADPESLAIDAYRIADAMLKERQK